MSFVKRLDGRIEWTCRHGIGHTIFSTRKGLFEFVHGCDGCCSSKVYKEAKKRFDKVKNYDDLKNVLKQNHS
jgi:hypothetical protein